MSLVSKRWKFIAVATSCLVIFIAGALVWLSSSSTPTKHKRRAVIHHRLNAANPNFIRGVAPTAALSYLDKSHITVSVNKKVIPSTVLALLVSDSSQLALTAKESIPSTTIVARQGIAQAVLYQMVWDYAVKNNMVVPLSEARSYEYTAYEEYRKMKARYPDITEPFGAGTGESTYQLYMNSNTIQAAQMSLTVRATLKILPTNEATINGVTFSTTSSSKLPANYSVWMKTSLPRYGVSVTGMSSSQIRSLYLYLPPNEGS